MLYCYVISSSVDEETSQWPTILYEDDWQQMSVIAQSERDVQRVNIVAACLKQCICVRDYYLYSFL